MLEIACFNKESAVIATKAGADRIEFCESKPKCERYSDWFYCHQ